MKKLIIAAAIVCAAVASQASQFKWGASNIKDYTGSSPYSGTAEIFVFLTSEGAESAVSYGTASMANGVIAATAVSDAALIGGQNYSMYMVMNDTVNGYVFTSSTLSQVLPTNQTFPVKMFTSGTWSAVPEPTSGLLLLLGVAGLALKRKRA